ncbi:MAG: hypothetical protein JNK75_01695 [Betaproteobacteria bacterium]|nr:hypothetical protein [Betaproteobacteria bacterium]
MQPLNRHAARLCAAAFLTTSLAAAAQSGDAPAKVIILPERAEAIYNQYHYAPAVRVGNRVIVSGIPAAGPGTYRDQVKRMFGIALSILRMSGASMADVIEIQTFHVNARNSDDFQKELADFLEVHKEYLPVHYPAWTAIGNAVLLAPGAVVEMRLEAVIGSGQAARVEKIPAAAPVTPATK